MTYLETGLNKKKLVYIISKEFEAIHAQIVKELGCIGTKIPIGRRKPRKKY